MKDFFLLLAIAFLCLGVHSVAAQGTELPNKKLASPDRMPYRHFGHDVDKSGDYVVAGQPSAYHFPIGSGLVPGAGRAYVYMRSADTLALQQPIWAADSANEDNFGWSVSMDYPYIAVGANGNATDANGGNTMPVAGAVYVYQHAPGSGQWVQVQKLVASDRHNYASFGTEVYLRDSVLVVGAYNTQATDSAGNSYPSGGAIYTFELNTNGTWNEVQKFSPVDVAAQDQFGFPIAPVGDGTIMVGATYEDHDVNGQNYVDKAGAVYVLAPQPGGGWVQQQKLVADFRPTTEWFGAAIAVEGDHAVIGATQGYLHPWMASVGAAYLFKRDSAGMWSQEQKIWSPQPVWYGIFGASVAMRDSLVLISDAFDPFDENGMDSLGTNGAVFAYTIGASDTLDYVGKFVSPTRDSTSGFARSLWLFDDMVVINHSDDHYNASYADSITQAGSLYFGCLPVVEQLNVSACGSYTGPNTGNVYTTTGPIVDSATTAAGCLDIASINLTIWPTSNDTIAAVTACNSYTSPSGNSTWTSSGVYSETLTTVHGCDSIVTVPLTITNFLHVSDSVTSCGAYTSSTGAVYTASGTYSDTIAVGTGCDSVITLELEITAIDTAVAATSFDVTALDNAAQYQWIDCGTNQPVAGATNATFAPTQTGTYAVVLTNGSCTDTSRCVSFTSVGISAPGQQQMRWHLQPNPASETVRVVFTGQSPVAARVSVRNMLGAVVSAPVVMQQGAAVLTVQGLVPGVYFVEVEHHGKVAVARLIKQ